MAWPPGRPRRSSGGAGRCTRSRSEEMLHLALVSNLMTAIGAAPVFGRPNFPQRSGYFPAGVQLDLLPFGEQALRHFLFLERPEGMDLEDAQGFVPAAPAREPVQPGEALPRGQEFATIGHLYRGIAEGLRGLAARLRGAGRVRRLPARPGHPGAAGLAAADRGHRSRLGAGGGGRDHRTGRGVRGRLAHRALRPVPRHVAGLPRPAAARSRRSSPPAPSCPATRASRSASPRRSRSSPIR